jgi:hypothetical protein
MKKQEKLVLLENVLHLLGDAQETLLSSGSFEDAQQLQDYRDEITAIILALEKDSEDVFWDSLNSKIGVIVKVANLVTLIASLAKNS